MADHAFLSASGSHRWLNCTASPLYEAQFPDSGTTVYAQEGTLAHSFCEAAALYNFDIINRRSYSAKVRNLQKNALYKDEMIKTAKFYADYLHDKSLGYRDKPYVTMEEKVDFSDIVPEGFGTCDCIMIGDDHLHITDYKHGKGVEVSAENNSQMRLYALGALKKFGPLFGGITRVSMAIVQPRITEFVSEEELTVEELTEWGETVKPIAQAAMTGKGAEFHAGGWCRFCRGRDVCRARAENALAVEDFTGIPIEGDMSPAERLVAANVLTDAEVGALLTKGAGIVAWYNDLQDYALRAILSGSEIEGYKVVAGRSVRTFRDTDEALKRIMDAGVDEALLYERKYKTLAELEKMLGKSDFAEICGDLVEKPMGRPTLVKASDKREPYNAAVTDFAEVADNR